MVSFCVLLDGTANQVKQFLGIPYEQSVQFWNATLKYYFGTDDADTLRAIEEKAAIICYARLLRRTLCKSKDDEAYKAKMVEYCKQTLCDLVPKTDSLAV